MRKYRHELKYIINSRQAEILKQRLKLVMEIDKNSIYSDNTYLIRSLYFDDLFSTSYYEKLDGILYRKKYRIRLYNGDTRFIRLECKYKHNNMTSKDQVLICKDLCSKILNGNIDDIETDNELLKSFILDIKTKHIMPSVIVDYKRLAYTYPISDVRITFDSHIKSGRYNYDLFDNIASFSSTMDDNIVVLEVKFNEILPKHIADILSTVPVYRQAVSKFALCRSMK